MRPNTDVMEYVGASGVPSPNDPIFAGRVVIDAGNKVPSEYTGGARPTKNAPDNKEFREKLKTLLSEKWGVTEVQYAEIEDSRWKTLKRVENNIYYNRGLMDDNVAACACYLGFQEKNAIK